MNYIATAEARWPDRRIIGDGPFAATSRDGGVVYLAMTESQQQAIALGVDHPVLVNLRPINFDAIPDREDAHERRQRRRAERANENLHQRA